LGVAVLVVIVVQIILTVVPQWLPALNESHEYHEIVRIVGIIDFWAIAIFGTGLVFVIALEMLDEILGAALKIKDRLRR
jgi:hypothetical protein